MVLDEALAEVASVRTSVWISSTEKVASRVDVRVEPGVVEVADRGPVVANLHLPIR